MILICQVVLQDQVKKDRITLWVAAFQDKYLVVIGTVALEM